MLWAISCVDQPIPPLIRDKVLQPHRDYLGTRREYSCFAGRDAERRRHGGNRQPVHRQRGQPRQGEGFSPTAIHSPRTGVFKSITITRMRKGQWNPGAAEGA